MANQGLQRRTVLDLLAKAAVASQFPGFSRWVFAGQQSHNHSGALAAPYQPLHFTPAEYRAIEILTDLILPADESPGAKDAGVSEFIDFMAAHGETELQEPFRQGLQWLDAAAQKAHGAHFAVLTAEEQNALLETIAYPKQAADPKGKAFFQVMRSYTVMGFYTSRIGLEELDYPGLRMYTESPACPHRDDPEHRHLPPPRI